MFSMLISAMILLALLGTGMMAGLFFAYSNSVMPALARMPGPQGMTAMNHINVIIQNPLFLSVFMGTAVIMLLLIVVALLGWIDRPAWILTGAALYLVGNIAVTVAINVPMNDALAAANPTGGDGAALWATFLHRWVFWNHVRALACTVALGTFAMAIK